MPRSYYEKDTLKELSNKELMEKCKDINNKCEILHRTRTNREVTSQLFEFKELYEEELDRRIEEDLIDEDEVEQYFEEHVI